MNLLKVSLLLPAALIALSNNYNVDKGSAHSIHAGNKLTIHNSPNTVLRWQDFNIAENECVHFAQQSSKSAVLNRVTGGHASNLLGQLSSNGCVYLD